MAFSEGREAEEANTSVEIVRVSDLISTDLSRVLLICLAFMDAGGACSLPQVRTACVLASLFSM